MELGLTGRVALVTGGSEGIGLATARRLAAEGARVALFARRPEVLAAAAQSIGAWALAIAGDVTVPGDIERAVAQTVAHFGQLDIVVNNAGTAAAAGLEHVTDEAWQRDLDLKLFAAVRVTRAAMPHLRRSSAPRVVNLTTVGGKQPAASSLPSSVTRAAGIALTKALSKELAPERILVNTVCVGSIRSAQQDRAGLERGQSTEAHYARLVSQIPLGRVGEADEVASVIAFLCSERASFVTGASINVDGGASGVV